jgi:hypothetical protein
MCDFLSGLVNLDCDKKLKIWAHDPRSHSETAAYFQLKPDTYREWEWTEDDDGASLVVRTATGDHETNWYRACILAKYPNRAAMLDYCLQTIEATHIYLNDCKSLKEVPCFPKATYISLNDCTALKEVPCFPEATHIYLSGCTALKEVPCFPKATTIYLNDCKSLKEVPCFPKATYIYLNDCKSLKEVPKSLKGKCYTMPSGVVFV